MTAASKPASNWRRRSTALLPKLALMGSAPAQAVLLERILPGFVSRHGLEGARQLIEDCVQCGQGPVSHTHEAGVATRTAPAGNLHDGLVQALELVEVGELRGDGRADETRAGPAELDGPGILVELLLGAGGAHLAPLAEGGTLEVHARGEEGGPGPVGLMHERVVHMHHGHERRAAHAPLARWLGKVRDQCHVARAPRRGQYCCGASQRVGVVAVEVRGHGAAGLVAQELADRREAAGVGALLLALLQLVLHKPRHQPLGL
mmetsp:Transcript_152207/g.369643  ORF Transcript_152207/g.369643 Transcript_152207/m.369643 type:complete len:262 (+) Transcript_152207:167-952(+)